MTPERQQQAMAEALGWSFDGSPGFADMNYRPWTDSKGVKWKTPPDWGNDLNAMHEAIHAQPISVKLAILSELEKMLAGPCDTKLRVTFATAAQRAEAFLRALGKWEDLRVREWPEGGANGR